MSNDVETVVVKGWAPEHTSGVVINKSDFNPDIHELFGAKKPVTEKPVTENEFLKRKAVDIIADLAALTDEDLAVFRADEVASANRAGVISAFDKEISARAEAAKLAAESQGQGE